MGFFFPFNREKGSKADFFRQNEIILYLESEEGRLKAASVPSPQGESVTFGVLIFLDLSFLMCKRERTVPDSQRMTTCKFL